MLLECQRWYNCCGRIAVQSVKRQVLAAKGVRALLRTFLFRQTRRSRTKTRSVTPFVLLSGSKSQNQVTHQFAVRPPLLGTDTLLARRIGRPCMVSGDGKTLRRLVKLSDVRNVSGSREAEGVCESVLFVFRAGRIAPLAREHSHVILDTHVGAVSWRERM